MLPALTFFNHRAPFLSLHTEDYDAALQEYLNRSPAGANLVMNRTLDGWQGQVGSALVMKRTVCNPADCRVISVIGKGRKCLTLATRRCACQTGWNRMLM